MTKAEMITLLSEDYADRAARSGLKYDDALEQYKKRCITRSEDSLASQVITAGLDRLRVNYLV